MHGSPKIKKITIAYQILMKENWEILEKCGKQEEIPKRNPDL
jgi:hypothetical protein